MDSSPSGFRATFMTTDRDWLRRYLDGDERAFRIFYERHRRAVFTCLLAIVARRETAEELLQETFLALIRTLCDRPQAVLGDRTELRPYLLRAARHRAIDHLRRNARERRALEKRGPTRLLAGETESRAPLTGEELEEFLAKLPEEQRETVLLRTVGDLTFREIADITFVSENTAVARFRYAVMKLRDWLRGATDLRIPRTDRPSYRRREETR
ncbi:MAG TPA: sigma-70 family RNA polymerase sigma factor [Planctomycetota bacterium]|nr:sigma-70 family RNA polymerase sigma factor [Planctomycetota bacterium]